MLADGLVDFPYEGRSFSSGLGCKLNVLAELSSRYKRVVASACQDHATDRGVSAAVLKVLQQLAVGIHAHRIARRPINRQDLDRVVGDTT